MTLAPLSGPWPTPTGSACLFARLISGVQIYGDAWTWWRQAVGKYDTGHSPRPGAVLCFKPSGKMKLGHVAVVSQVLTDRVIQITHANWSRIGGTRGQIEKDVTVIDVSPAGDWSEVKVWYDPVRDLGSSTYPTHGFIYQDAAGAADGQLRPQQRPERGHRRGPDRRDPGRLGGPSGRRSAADARPGAPTPPTGSPP